MRKLSFLVVAFVVFVSTFSLTAKAQEFDGTVKTVAATNAPALITKQIDETKLVPLASPAIPTDAKDLGPASGDTKLGMQLVLERSYAQEQALKLLNQQSLQPGTPSYGKVLTPEVFAETFGLAGSDLDTLKSTLEAAGFTVGNVDNGRLTIDFEGTVSQVNAAFHTDIHNFTAADGSQHFAPASALQIPKALADAVREVHGVQNFTVENRQSFNGPVADFAAADEKVQTAASGKAIEPNLTGEALHDASFTASKYVLGLKGSTTLNIRIGGNNHPVTGSLSIEDQNGKVVGFIADVTKCEPYGNYGRSCTVDYQPPVGAVRLRAIYSGDDNERGMVISNGIISRAGTSTNNVSATASNFDMWTSTPSQTMTITIAYIGNATNTTATAPTGTVTIYYYAATPVAIATITLGNTSGSGTSTNGNAYTYSCPAANTTTQTVTCTFTMANAYADAVTQTAYDLFDYQATYNGDTNYASALNYAITYSQRRAGTAAPTTHTSSGNATATYGTAYSDNIAGALSGAGATGNSLCGTNAAPSGLSYYATTGTGAVATPSEIGGGAFFQMFNGSTYCSSSSTYSQTITVTGNTWVAPGVYPILSNYSGNTGVNTATYLVNGVALTSTAMITVNKYTPTLSAVTVTPSSVVVGSNTAVTLSDTFTVPAIGVLPSGAVTFTLNSVAYTATCLYTGTAGALACSATVPGVTIAALAQGTYTVTSAFAGDNFYGAVATGGTGTLGVLQALTATMTAPTSGSPVAQQFGALSAFTVSGQLTYTGASVPTFANVSFTSTAAGVFGTVTCVGSSSPISCSATFTPTGTDAVGNYNINISFTADSHYVGSTSTQVGNYIIWSLALSPSPITSVFGSVTPITIAATSSGAQTGTVTFSGTYATYGALSATTCTLAAGTCSVVFTPNGTTAIGTYSNILTASVAASGIYGAASVNDSLTITAQPTILAVTVAPVGFFANVNSGVFTTVIAWTNPALIPTGTISVTTGARSIGTITLSPTGAAIASTACTTAGTVGTCTYTCAAAANLMVSCSITNTKTSGTISATTSVADVTETNTMAAAYSGDSNFAASTASSTYLYNVNSYNNPSVPGSLAISGTPLVSPTYGLTQAEGPTVKITTADAENPNAGNGFLDIFSTGATGTMYYTGLTSCTTSGCSIVTSWTFPAVVTPGAYTITYDYSGNYENLSGDTSNTTTTSSLTVNKQTPTFGTMTFSPAASEPYGTNQAITISDTLTYLGVGEAPQGAVTYTLNSVPYTATCTITGVSGSGNSQATVKTCTATVPGATIAALAVNAYTVAAAYTTDTNYAACTGSGTFTITQATLSSIALAAVTPGSPSGGVNSSVFNATISPAINGVSVTFTDTTTGLTVGTATTTAGVASITVNTAGTGTGQSSKPSGGLNNFTAQVAATANYSAVGPSSPVTPVYYNGILYSLTAGHDFSICYANSNGTGSVVPCAPYVSPQSGGTLDGSQICGAGINGYSCTTGFGVTVYNFTSSAQAIGVNLVNAASGAFSSATNCPANLAAGATCQYAFYYKPPYGDGNSTTVGLYEAGSWTASVPAGVLTGIGDTAFDRSGPTTFPATLSGYAVLTATNPVSVTPLSLTFGPQAQGAQSATQDILVTNNGTAAIGMTYTPPVPAGFIVTNNCPSSLSQGASCSIGIAYKSSTVGTSSGYETITAAGQSPIQVAVSGTVVSNVLSLSTASVNMGSVNDGSTATQSVTLTNSSSASATISLATSGSTEFTYNYGSCGSSLAAGASCTVSATFAPTAAGAVSNVLTVTSSIPVVPGGTGSGPYMGTVTFSGTGVSGTGKLTVGTSTHNFGNVSVNSTGTAYGVTMTNSTGAAVTLALGPVSAPFTAATNCGSTLANGASCQFVFNFTPTADGFVSAVYSISANGGAVPLFSTAANGDVSGITLEGTGIN